MNPEFILGRPVNRVSMHPHVEFLIMEAVLVPWVPEVCLAWFPVSVNVSIVTRAIVGLRPSAGKSRSGPQETSGTQGTVLENSERTLAE